MATQDTLGAAFEPLYSISKYIGILPFTKTMQFCERSWRISIFSLIMIETLVLGAKLYAWIYGFYRPNLGFLRTLLITLKIAFDFAIILSHTISMIMKKRKMANFGKNLATMSENYSYSLSTPKFYTILGLVYNIFVTVYFLLCHGWTVRLVRTAFFEVYVHCIIMLFCAFLEAYLAHFKDLVNDVGSTKLEPLTRKALRLISSCEKMNELYGSQLLFLCLRALSRVVLTGFLLAIEITTLSPNDLMENLFNLAIQTGVLFYEFYLLMMVTASCRQIKILMETFNALVFRELRQNKEFMNDNKLNLYIAKNPLIHFSASGYFCISPQLVTSIFATATTYIVIIFQLNS